MVRLLVFVMLAMIPQKGFGQKKFRNANQFSEWIMNYYKNPEPQHLYQAFEFGAQNKTVAESGSRRLMMSFIAAAIKDDTVLINDFTQRLAKTDNNDFIYGYMAVLWYMNTDFSVRHLEKFRDDDHFKKYKRDFESSLVKKPKDLLVEEIDDPEQLDMLWAQFFATGDEAYVSRIASTLNDMNSQDPGRLTIAGSAKWSLISNSIQHDKVFEICKKLSSTITDTAQKKQLNEIVTEAGKKRK